jgi:hypothetical protein
MNVQLLRYPLFTLIPGFQPINGLFKEFGHNMIFYNIGSYEQAAHCDQNL